MGLLYIIILFIYKQIPSGDPEIKVKEEVEFVCIISHHSIIYLAKIVKLNKKTKSGKLHLYLRDIKNVWNEKIYSLLNGICREYGIY